MRWTDVRVSAYMLVHNIREDEHQSRTLKIAEATLKTKNDSQWIYSCKGLLVVHTHPSPARTQQANSLIYSCFRDGLLKFHCRSVFDGNLTRSSQCKIGWADPYEAFCCYCPKQPCFPIKNFIRPGSRMRNSSLVYDKKQYRLVFVSLGR